MHIEPEREAHLMTITLVNSAVYSTTGTGGTKTIDAGLNPGRVVIAFVIYREDSVSVYSIVGMTALEDIENTDASPSLKIKLYYDNSVVTGNNYYDFTFLNVGSKPIVYGLMAFDRVSTSNPFGTIVEATGNSDEISVSPTIETDGLAVDVVTKISTGTTITVGSGQTQIFKEAQESGNTFHGAASYETGSAGAIALTWSLGIARPWASIGIPLRHMSAGRRLQSVLVI